MSWRSEAFCEEEVAILKDRIDLYLRRKEVPLHLTFLKIRVGC